MPLYEYKAYNSGGKTIKGLIDAPSIASAHGKLKAQGLFPIEINKENSLAYKKSVSSTDMTFALEQLSTLLKAGIPLPEALDSLVSQLSNNDLRIGFARVKVHLEEGHNLANSLATEGIFPPILVKMVETGESVGAIDKILERFSGFLEKETAFREKIITSMTYPSIIILASFGLIFFVLTYIAPTLGKVFSSFNQEMPLPTRILLSVGNFLKNNSILLFILTVGTIFSFIKFVPKYIKDSMFLKIPIFGKIHLHTQMSRWARTLSMLHGGGVSLLKALSSSREIIDNEVLKNNLKLVEDYVKKGEGLGSALSKIPLVPQLFIQMTQTGEKSGQLEKLLNTAANFYEKEVDQKLSIFFKFLEPAVIILLGLVVGFIVMAALLPILEMNRLIR